MMRRASSRIKLLLLAALLLLSVVAAAARNNANHNNNADNNNDNANNKKHRVMHTLSHEPASPILDSITASGGCYAITAGLVNCPPWTTTRVVMLTLRGAQFGFAGTWGSAAGATHSFTI
jgi:hypothetical protein